DREFTTLRPVVADDLWGLWTTSRSVAGLTANAPYTVAQLVAALDAGEAAKVLAFGVFVNAGDTVLVRGISFNGDDYLFYTGEPTLTASVTSLELKNVTQPITLTASGFQPGQDVYFGVGNGGSGGGIGDAPVVADASGVATVQYSFPADTELGTYYFSAADESGYFGVSIEFTVIANQLAATGEGVNPWFLGAGILLALGGTGAIIFARRAKKA
ncbi:MAG TPA: LPXTG cell wall anchor domain-containing protein, partial [Rhodoglobus sp.]|nr:LPXTG cell wall anchor domain-containing protein [Rhodoglobus sp.]